MTPLSAFPIVSTKVIDEAEATMSQELANLQLLQVKRQSNFSLKMNGLHLGEALLSYTQFDTDVTIDTGELEDTVAVLLGYDKPSQVFVDDVAVSSATEIAMASSPRTIRHHYAGGGGFLVLRVDQDVVNKRLESALDRTLSEPVQFDCKMGMEHAYGANIKQLVSFLIECAQRDPNAYSSPLLRSTYNDLVINTLLSAPSNYSAELALEKPATVAPAVVRRAENYLAARAAEPVTIDELLIECGCSRRSLFKTFHDTRGYSPMQFLASCRLDLARKALLSGKPGDSVSSIAYDSGFSHPSRFAAAYVARFGEKPSDTLRRARALH